MPQSPKERMSSAQEGLFRKETWAVSLCERAAPVSGHWQYSLPSSSARWAGGGSGCKEQQQSRSVAGWHTHVGEYQVGLGAVVFRGWGSTGQMSSKWNIHVRSSPQVLQICDSWKLQMVLKVQSCSVPDMGSDEKNLGSSPLRGRRFLAYINPSHKMIFSFMNLQKGFKEIIP